MFAILVFLAAVVFLLVAAMGDAPDLVRPLARLIRP